MQQSVFPMDIMESETAPYVFLKVGTEDSVLEG